MFKTRMLAGIVLALGLSALARPARADDLADNAKAQAAAAGKTYENAWLRLRGRTEDQSAATIEALHLWSRRWVEAEQETSDKKEDRVAATQAHLERMMKPEDLVKTLHDRLAVAGADPAAAEFYRLEAERQVLLAKGRRAADRPVFPCPLPRRRVGSLGAKTMCGVVPCSHLRPWRSPQCSALFC